MTSGFVAAAVVPHAPQFLSLPDTEDLEQVGRVKTKLREVGDVLRDKKPDAVVVLSNDHGDHFVTHGVPPFCVHVGAEADGMHKHRGPWAIDSALGYALVPEMSANGFDLAFTLGAKLPTAFTIPFEFMGFSRETRMTAIFVNAYMPPQPSAQRCFAFGQALERALCKLGYRAVLIASGGMSHYPGTKHYPHPDIETDRALFARMERGELTHLAGLTANEMDRTGNVELRMIQILAGVVGDQRPFAALLEPSWHHIYATLGWDLENRNELADAHPLIYPALPSHRAALVQAVFRLRTRPEDARAFLADAAAYCDRFALAVDERDALMNLDEETLRDHFSVHGLLTAGARMQVDMQRKNLP
jgi:2,3-dihydroxyphenylpropionate 1,2-dioxygenase